MRKLNANMRNWTSSGNIKAEFENSMANITTKSSLIGTIHRYDVRLTGFLPFLDQHGVVIGNPHYQIELQLISETKKHKTLLSRKLNGRIVELGLEPKERERQRAGRVQKWTSANGGEQVMVVTCGGRRDEPNSGVF